MFERFTDRARKAVALANSAAERMHHEYLAPEHIAFGILVEGSGIAVTILDDLGVDRTALLNQIQLSLEGMTRTARAEEPHKAPHAPMAKAVIVQAIALAREYGHSGIGTEHLLLAMVTLPDCAVGSLFIRAGAGEEAVRGKLPAAHGHDSPTASFGGAIPGPSPMELAQHDARRIKDLLTQLRSTLTGRPAELLDELETLLRRRRDRSGPLT